MNSTFQAAQNFDRMMQQTILAGAALSLIGTLIFFTMLYFTIRWAIRDGLRDAQSVDRRSGVTRSRDVINGPEIKID